ncbi:MAG: hypothetical protein HC803_03170 [Saprospiraceae bacterium]|nr:hypothetical protein [Saprospiraceae bacterium]
MNTSKIYSVLIAIGILLTNINFTYPAYSKKQNEKDNFPEWLQGEWRGIGYQLNTSGTWSIQLKVNTERASIAYPSLECSGNWQIVKQDKEKIELIEIITEGTDKCVNKGKLILTKIDDNHITYTYFSPFSGELEAFSTLIRKSHLDKLKDRA